MGGVTFSEGRTVTPFAALAAALKALRDNPDPDRREVLDGIVSHYRAYLGVAWEREAKKHGVTCCRRCGQPLTAKDSVDLWLVDGPESPRSNRAQEGCGVRGLDRLQAGLDAHEEPDDWPDDVCRDAWCGFWERNNGQYFWHRPSDHIVAEPPSEARTP